MNEIVFPVLMELTTQWGREALNSSNDKNTKYVVFQIVIIVVKEKSRALYGGRVGNLPQIGQEPLRQRFLRWRQ